MDILGMIHQNKPLQLSYHGANTLVPLQSSSRGCMKNTTWNWKNDYLGAIYMYFESNPKSVKTKLRCIESWEPQRAGAAEGRSRRGAEPRRCAQFLLH